MTYLGMKKDYDKLDDLSEERSLENLAITKRLLSELKTYDYESLNAQDKLSYELFKKGLEEQIESFKFRYHNYPVNQMFGWQSSLPSFFMIMHRVDNEEDMKAYISRLSQVQRQASQVVAGINKRTKLGIIPPKFVFPAVIRDSKNIISGFPFTDDPSKPSTLYADVEKKISALDLDASKKQLLLTEAKSALVNSVKPGYELLISTMETLEAKAPAQAAASSLPDGKAYYQMRLNDYTTTDWSAEKIHQIGLSEVARIQAEMNKIKDKVGFKGSLQEFFKYMQNRPESYYPQTPEGRKAYLEEAKKLIANFKKRMPEVFGILPKADVEVRAVEAYREESAGKAFYNSPALDGSRPGIYYVNLYDLKQVPRYEMEALAYHEALPGHHLQLAISQELKGLPKFRTLSGYTAYSEGWGLYSELLPKDMGFYQDPFSDFGRLSMELWRACRLVVDTGLHAKGWTREKAIDYLRANTPSSKGDTRKAIERYIVMPGQATAYKIGSMKILELREKAKEALGEKFSLAGFHDTILKNGPLPLDVLEEQIDLWIEKNQSVSH